MALLCERYYLFDLVEFLFNSMSVLVGHFCQRENEKIDQSKCIQRVIYVAIEDPPLPPLKLTWGQFIPATGVHVRLTVNKKEQTTVQYKLSFKKRRL